jgi:hypothetical protein
MGSALNVSGLRTDDSNDPMLAHATIMAIEWKFWTCPLFTHLTAELALPGRGLSAPTAT